MTDASLSAPDDEELPFELQVEPVAGFEALGAAELHELPHGELQRALKRASPDLVGESVLGSSLWINGRAVGYPRVLKMPGRFSLAIKGAIDRVITLHALMRAAPPEGEATPTPAPDDAPTQAASPGEA